MVPALLAVMLLLPSAARAQGPLIVLDPGHIPSYPGARGACGGKEVDYNDAVAAEVEAALSAGGARVRFTREPGHSVRPQDDSAPPLPEGREGRESLLERADIANRLGASLFISIHHDSTEDKNLYFDPAACDGRGGTRMRPEFKAAHAVGYDVWVYEGGAANRARFTESLRLAADIGRRMRAAGMVASDFHIRPFEDCASCRPVDKADGVWNQDLAVLKNTTMPAILIECENLADPDFQKIADSSGFRRRVARAVAEGVAAYESGAPAREPAPLGVSARIPRPQDAAARLLSN